MRSENRVENFVYHPINPIHDVIIASVIFCVGLVLNALILRCFWSVKTSTAVYIRVLAWVDIAAPLNALVLRVLLIFFQNHLAVHLTDLIIAGQFILVSVLGPLFMALDRILIVAFPHNFKKHEKKMRIVKAFIIMFHAIITILILFPLLLNVKASISVNVILSVSAIAFALECLTTVILYAVIVWKIRKSSRQIQPAQQTGNQ